MLVRADAYSRNLTHSRWSGGANAKSLKFELAICFPLQGERQCWQWRVGLSREATRLLCVSHGLVLKGPSNSWYEPRHGLSLIQVPVEAHRSQGRVGEVLRSSSTGTSGHAELAMKGGRARKERGADSRVSAL